MRGRRAWLIGLSTMIATTAARRSAAVDGDVETAAYGGESRGGWICGPPAVVRYGGVAGEVHLRERPESSRDGAGLIVTAGGAAESQSITVLCESPRKPACAPRDRTPILGGLHGRLGYGGESVEVEVGGGAFQGFPSPTATSPAWSGYPELTLRFGELAGRGWHLGGLLGGGASRLTSIERPGGQFGMFVSSPGGYGVDARAVLMRSGASVYDDIAAGGDVALRMPLAPRLDLRAGAVVLETGGRASPEASLGFVAHL